MTGWPFSPCWMPSKPRMDTMSANSCMAYCTRHHAGSPQPPLHCLCLKPRPCLYAWAGVVVDGCRPQRGDWRLLGVPFRAVAMMSDIRSHLASDHTQGLARTSFSKHGHVEAQLHQRGSKAPVHIHLRAAYWSHTRVRSSKFTSGAPKTRSAGS